MPIGIIIAVGLAFVAPYLLTFVVTLIGSLNIHIANWLSDLFWNVLGQNDMFEIIANTLQTALGKGYTPIEFVVNATVAVVVGAFMDAAVIATCIYLVKSFCANFSQSGGLWYSFFGVKILSKYVSVVGVVLGVVVTNLFKNQVEMARQLIYAGTSIAFMILGVMIMIGKSSVIPSWKKRDRLITNLLIDILIDMSLAISTAVIATCSLEGPRIIFQAGNLSLLFGYLAVEAIMLSVAWGIAVLARKLKR